MLAINVSLLRRRAAIAADVAEAAAAVDNPGTGNVVFATLVDDPASVGDRVDAFLGQIMLEAASASSTVTAGFAYAGAVSEAASAADLLSSSVPIAGTVAEAATAASTQDGTVVGAVPSRSAMVAGPWPVFINPGTSRQANANGVMINL